MDMLFVITIFLIGFVGSFISGMVGVGGSIIKYPMLLFIPPFQPSSICTKTILRG